MRAVVELMISQSAPWAGLKMLLNTVKLNTSNGENWIVGFFGSLSKFTSLLLLICMAVRARD